MKKTFFILIILIFSASIGYLSGEGVISSPSVSIGENTESHSVSKRTLPPKEIEKPIAPTAPIKPTSPFNKNSLEKKIIFSKGSIKNIRVSNIASHPQISFSFINTSDNFFQKAIIKAALIDRMQNKTISIAQKIIYNVKPKYEENITMTFFNYDKNNLPRSWDVVILNVE